MQTQKRTHGNSANQKRKLSDTYQTTSPTFEEMRYRINCFMLLYMARPSSTAATIVEKLSSASTISEAVLATAVPDPIAIPISAFFKAGASLTPSPV